MPTNRFAWAEPRLRAAHRETFEAASQCLGVMGRTRSEQSCHNAWDEYRVAMVRWRHIDRLLRACERGVLPPKEGTR